MIKRHIIALRIFEVFIMTGFFMIAGVFAIDKINEGVLINLFIAFIVSFFLILAIYQYNAFAGYAEDKQNQRLQKIKKLKPHILLILSFSFFATSISFSFLLNPNLWIFIIITKILWVLYSFPKRGLKTIPFAGSILHFIAQIIHFNMIWFVFKCISIESISLSVFFSFLFSAGHINHELIDYETDKVNNIKTGALTLGYKSAAMLSFFIFLIAHFYLIILYFFSLINLPMLIIFFVGFFIQAAIYFSHGIYLKINQQKNLGYRRLYRIIVFLECVLLLIYKFGTN